MLAACYGQDVAVLRCSTTSTHALMKLPAGVIPHLLGYSHGQTRLAGATTVALRPDHPNRRTLAGDQPLRQRQQLDVEA